MKEGRQLPLTTKFSVQKLKKKLEHLAGYPEQRSFFPSPSTRHFLLGARKHAISLTAAALRENGQMAIAHWGGLAGSPGYRHRKEWVALR